jgi:protein SCO1/2
MNPAKRLLVLLFVSLAFAGGAFFTYLAFVAVPSKPSFATVLPEPMALPDIALIDDAGKPFTRESLRGEWHLLFFGFTHCPDICPATLQQLAIASRRVTEAGGKFPQVILVSVDPERDTPDVLAAYVRNFGDNVRGVTGDLDSVRALTSALGIYFAKSEVTDTGYNVDHSAAVLVIDDDANWRALFSAPQDVERLVHDIPILTGAS